MNLNWKIFIRATSVMSLLTGLFMTLPLIISFVNGENNAAAAFLISMIPLMIIGGLVYSNSTPSHTSLTVRDGFLIVSFSWVLVSLMGALPYFISGEFPGFADAFFEAASGFSTTGASILTDIEAMPRGLLFWRAFTHWIGGMGILVFTIAMLPSLGTGANIIASAEAPGPTMDKITPKMSDTAKHLYIIYSIFTFVLIVLLKIAGMNWFDAFTNAFSTIGTGGFASYNNSIAYYNSPLIEAIIIVFMILAGTNFNLYFFAFHKRTGIAQLFADEEFRYYIGIIGVISTLIAINLCLSDIYGSFLESFRYSSFQTVSIMTTTGFATADFDVWPTFSKMLIFLLFFIGGCSSSTSGGIKVVRVLIMLKLIKRAIQVSLHPNAIVTIKLNEKKISIDTVSIIANFIFLTVLTAFTATLIVTLNGFDLVTSFSAVLTCIGNIGPGFNLVGPSMNFSIFSAPVKVLLSFLMIGGRLELYTFIIVFTPHFWAQDK
ncbi:MAG: TrkH family potassium uptake protein [Anaerovoracaceae bacterium]